LNRKTPLQVSRGKRGKRERLGTWLVLPSSVISKTSEMMGYNQELKQIRSSGLARDLRLSGKNVRKNVKSPYENNLLTLSGRPKA